MSEQELHKTEMTDQDLEKVQGGGMYWYKDIKNDKYYRFIGNDDKDMNRKFVCPKCGRRVHYGKAWRFYCDECNESWFLEENLKPNLNSGVWLEIDALTYYDNNGTWAR